MPKKRFSVLNFLKSLDTFGSGVTFNIDGEETVKSYIGAFFSVALICLTLVYAFTKWQVMLNFEDTNHQETIDYLDDIKNEVYRNEDTKFNFAFGL